MNRLDNKKIHFSRNLIEILNKSVISSANLNITHDTNCWINNENFYKTLDTLLVDFYLERYKFLSKEKRNYII